MPPIVLLLEPRRQDSQAVCETQGLIRESLLQQCLHSSWWYQGWRGVDTRGIIWSYPALVHHRRGVPFRCPRTFDGLGWYGFRSYCCCYCYCYGRVVPTTMMMRRIVRRELKSIISISISIVLVTATYYCFWDLMGGRRWCWPSRTPVVHHILLLLLDDRAAGGTLST